MKFNSYQKVAIATVGATIFLIFVGGLVRAAGAGLGCPDWPKCFGMWIPPTDVSQLPSGFDASLFNPWLTWIEYINRLIGVVIGLLIVATFGLSFRYRTSKPTIFWASLAALVLVIFQGWLGGQVVETELSEWLITAHMVVAMIIVNILLYAAFSATESVFSSALPRGERKLFFWLGIALMASTMIQLWFGTQVREAVDHITNNSPDLARSTWLAAIGTKHFVHRSFAWLPLLIGAFLTWKVVKGRSSPIVTKLSVLVLALILFQIVLGVGLNYLGMPPTFQILHLTFFAILVCAEFLFLLVTAKSQEYELVES